MAKIGKLYILNRSVYLRDLKNREKFISYVVTGPFFLIEVESTFWHKILTNKLEIGWIFCLSTDLSELC